jgi:hypothetical protein
MRRRLTWTICLMAGLGLAVGLWSLVRPDSRPRSTAGLQLPRDHGPFINGAQIDTISGAEALFGRHIIRPSHGQAGDGTIRKIFVERITGDPNEVQTPLRADVVHVAIDYQSGVLVTVELEAGTQSLFETDPASQYALMVGDTPGAETTTVLGAPAMTMPRTATEPAVVDVTIRGERVVIYSDHSSLEVDGLLDIAQTLV